MSRKIYRLQTQLTFAFLEKKINSMWKTIYELRDPRTLDAKQIVVSVKKFQSSASRYQQQLEAFFDGSLSLVSLREYETLRRQYIKHSDYVALLCACAALRTAEIDAQCFRSWDKKSRALSVSVKDRIVRYLPPFLSDYFVNAPMTAAEVLKSRKFT